MDAIESSLRDIWECISMYLAMLPVLKIHLSNCLLDSYAYTIASKALKHLFKTPQYFLVGLAVYGTARALKLYKTNALIQSHKRSIQSVIDKIDWYREHGFDGNIRFEEIEHFIIGSDEKIITGLDNEIRSVLTDTSAIEWPGGPDLASYGTFFENSTEKFSVGLYQSIKTRSGTYLSATEKREVKIFLSGLMVSLEQYGAAIEQVYMLSPKIFHKFWIWNFSKQFSNSRKLDIR